MARFEIEGSGLALQQLSDALKMALNQARRDPYRRGSVHTKSGELEVAVAVSEGETLNLRAHDRESAVLSAGFAEVKKCFECRDIVALLFDDAYLEQDNQGNVICCQCWRKHYDDE
ncbi:MAG: hypothetical protein ACREUQ_13450 [Burkholderiales bacterium]